MTVDPAATKWHHENAERTYFFCSERCMKKFAADPAQYLSSQTSKIPTASLNHTGRKTLAAPTRGVVYTCPMHPEIRQPAAGPCPICGMAVEPVIGLQAQAAAPAAEYFCPMDPDIVQDHPGACPKCGMALQARSLAFAAGGDLPNPELTDMTRRF
ncbi:MAG TPA: heavy metal-binding domain-containing protein, partial [Candidatus Binataceae bacterium]|nr:heavy metal-binding domain-containing protein [Candidatus Binataceae bacterium]